jgi:ribosomal protein S14
MSLRALNKKDKKFRIIFNKCEYSRIILKSLSYNVILPLTIREHIFMLLKDYGHISNTRIRNRCVISNKSRYIFTKYKLSRLSLKRLLVTGKIMGMYKVT